MVVDETVVLQFGEVPDEFHGWGGRHYLVGVQGCGDEVGIEEFCGRDSMLYVITSGVGRVFTYGDRSLIMNNEYRPIIKFKYVLKDGDIQTWNDVATRFPVDE